MCLKVCDSKYFGKGVILYDWDDSISFASTEGEELSKPVKITYKFIFENSFADREKYFQILGYLLGHSSESGLGQRLLNIRNSDETKIKIDKVSKCSFISKTVHQVEKRIYIRT